MCPSLPCCGKTVLTLFQKLPTKSPCRCNPTRSLHRLARQALVQMELLITSSSQGGKQLAWSLPQQARSRAAAIVASAAAAGALPRSVQAADGASARKRGRQPGAEEAAEEPATSSSKRYRQEQQESGGPPAADVDPALQVQPWVPLQRRGIWPSVGPESSPFPSAANHSAVHDAAAGPTRSAAATAAAAAAAAGVAPSPPAQLPQPSATAPPAMAGAAPSRAATPAADASGGGGGSGPAQLLPAPEELEGLLAAPPGEVELLPLAAEQLLEVVEWAGVDAAQVGRGAFCQGLPP